MKPRMMVTAASLIFVALIPNAPALSTPVSAAGTFAISGFGGESNRVSCGDDRTLAHLPKPAVKPAQARSSI